MPSLSSPLLKAAAAAVVALALGGAYFTATAAKPAPEVTFTTTSGQSFSTRDLRGKVVLVNFWATSCTTCVHEMPAMADTYAKYHGQGLEFVAVAMAYDSPGYVDNFVAARKLPFTMVLDSKGTLADAFGRVALTPTTFVIGRDGKILRKYVGEPKFDELHSLIEGALHG